MQSYLLYRCDREITEFPSKTGFITYFENKEYCQVFIEKITQQQNTNKNKKLVTILAGSLEKGAWRT